MLSKQVPSFVVLAILDGWGIAKNNPGNAITQASTPNMNKFRLSYPHTILEASGESVGLPKGEAGNTETGHLNLGAGRIVYQDLERINMAIIDGSFFTNRVLLSAIKHAKENKSNLHYMGLIGAGGVHSNLEHLLALIRLSVQQKFTDVYLHLFTDGRDSPPTAAKTYVRKISDFVKKQKVGTIASIMGRYWAMDRDQRWNRTEKAYLALTRGEGRLVRNAEDVIDFSYSEGKTDEFIEPSIVVDKEGQPVSLIKDNDSVVFFNFRVDRPRQLTKAFVFDDFSKANISFAFDPHQVKYERTHIKEAKTNRKEPFERGVKLKNLYFVTMTEYGKPITNSGAVPAFPPEVINAPIGSAISTNRLRQLRITESEKERFVTFYLNGLREASFPQEERVIIPSPPVTTYDQKPEMSAAKITEVLCSKIRTSEYKFIVVNYPNVDMVGHTGNLKKAIEAVEYVDKCLGKLASFVLSYKGALIITSDHGNTEEMLNAQSGEIDTEHSSNPVPLIIAYEKFIGKSRTLRSGILADVAPTILNLLEIPVPASMTGRNLLAGLYV